MPQLKKRTMMYETTTFAVSHHLMRWQCILKYYIEFSCLCTALLNCQNSHSKCSQPAKIGCSCKFMCTNHATIHQQREAAKLSSQQHETTTNLLQALILKEERARALVCLFHFDTQLKQANKQANASRENAKQVVSLKTKDNHRNENSKWKICWLLFNPKSEQPTEN